MQSASKSLAREGEALSLAISFGADGGPGSRPASRSWSSARTSTATAATPADSSGSATSAATTAPRTASTTRASRPHWQPARSSVPAARSWSCGGALRRMATRCASGTGSREWSSGASPSGRSRPQTATVVKGRRVIVAAGALGSVRLLLRSARHLHPLSKRLGKGFGSNGEHMTVATGCRTPADDFGDAGAFGELLDSAHGPVTTSVLRMAAANGHSGGDRARCRLPRLPRLDRAAACGTLGGPGRI